MTRHAGPGGNRGAFIAWDATTGKAVWSVPEKFLVYSGALVTAGDVVFYGTVDGYFKALDAHTGQELWHFKTGSGVIGAPITYLGPDGKQYVAVLTGVGGAAGVDSHVDGYPSEGGELYVFSL
jgi:alcohol dehydrogenase (cytochrome c)